MDTMDEFNDNNEYNGQLLLTIILKWYSKVYLLGTWLMIWLIGLYENF